MLTQISIQPQGGCQPEYTKIVSHSFVFDGEFTSLPTMKGLYFGGTYVGGMAVDNPIWSVTNYTDGERYSAGNLSFKYTDKSVGIPLPINLVAEDKVTLSGTALYPETGSWLEAGFTSVNLIIGVYYFNCSTSLGEIPLYTFIPVTTVEFDEKGTACFSAEVTLGSNFDIHETRFVLGFNTYVVGDGVTPGVNTVASVSYTLDIQRPCKAEIDNFIIRNCCVPIITELVHIPGLVVGDFHVDDEGNCWEVIEASTDVTNFTRNFTDTYTSCVECQAANPCPLNLSISSCCVLGKEFVTGSLPGLGIGDTFVDNYGLCWTVTDETSEPISEESITVDTIIPGTCIACTTANPCPNFYYVKSCCASLFGYIALPDVLNMGDSFVDTNGNCWNVEQVDTEKLPTMYGIVVDTVYTGAVEPDTNCDLCTTANPCPTEYFITIRGCCDPERIEVAQVPAQYMIFNEGMLFNDWWGVCWEVMSFNTTGVETYPIWDWNAAKPAIGSYKECKECTCQNSNCKCKTFYEVRNCNTDVISIFKMQPNLTIGQFYINQLDKTCYEVLGYGYPAFNESPVAFNPETQWPDFYTCDECLIGTPAYKIAELQPCCGGPNITIGLWGPWVNGIGSVQYVQQSGVSEFHSGCYTLISVTNPGPGPYAPPDGYTNSGSAYADCTACTNVWPCN